MQLTGFTVPPNQGVNTTDTPSWPTITVNSLTATRLLATDASKQMITVGSLSVWVGGTANQITVTDSGDGSIGLGLPQNIHTTATPQFARIVVDQSSYPWIELKVAGQNIGYWGHAPALINSTNPDDVGFRYKTNLVFGVGVNERARLTAAGNLQIGTNTTSTGLASRAVLLANTALAPNYSPEDAAFIYALDISSGHSAIHMRTEPGDIVKLYKHTAMAVPSDTASLITYVTSLNALLSDLGLT